METNDRKLAQTVQSLSAAVRIVRDQRNEALDRCADAAVEVNNLRNQLAEASANLRRMEAALKVLEQKVQELTAPKANDNPPAQEPAAQVH